MSQMSHTTGFMANDDSPTIASYPNSPVISEFACICPYCQRRFGTMDEFTLHVINRHTWGGISKDATQETVRK